MTRKEWELFSSLFWNGEDVKKSRQWQNPKKILPLQTLRVILGRNLGSPDNIGTEPLKKKKKKDTSGPASKELGKTLKSEDLWNYCTHQSTVPK